MRAALRSLYRRMVSRARGVHRDISDETTRWMSFVNVGMQDPGNLWCFDYAIRNLPSEAPVLEIGAFMGLSANLITLYLRRHGRANPLITCDRWIGHKYPPVGGLYGTPITRDQYRQFLRDSFVRNLTFFSADRLPHAIEMFSNELFAAWDRGETVRDIFGREIRLGGSLGFAFIDGPHEYEHVRGDFTAVDRWLAAGGFILFDDSRQSPGVVRLVAEVARRGDYDLVVRNPNHLFRKRHTPRIR